MSKLFDELPGWAKQFDYEPALRKDVVEAKLSSQRSSDSEVENPPFKKRKLSQITDPQTPHNNSANNNTVTSLPGSNSETSTMDHTNANNSDMAVDQKPSDYYERYSRQHYVLGEKAMSKMAKSNVFVSGLGGVGVEIAKNVALAGVRKLTLHDTKNCTYLDLSTQYYLREADLGQNRAKVTVAHIAQLNPYVKVDVDTRDLNGDLSFLNGYHCVVLTGAPLAQQIRINDFCRANNIYFLTVDTYGVFGWAFADFGQNFEVFDKNGEEPKDVFLSHINQEKEAVVTTLENHIHSFEEGDVIKLTEVEGMSDLNYKEGVNPVTFKVLKVISPTKFRISADTSCLPHYVSGGIATEVKQSVVMHFIPLRESLQRPKILPSDYAKLDRLPHLHVAMQALHRFWELHKALPEPWNKDHAQEMVQLAHEINANAIQKVEQLNENLIRQLSFTAQGNIISLTAFMGGFFAQEVIKSISGKFTPLDQWFYFDATEILPKLDAFDSSQYLPIGCRADAQLICVGRTVTEKLENLRVFMIGTGAIGCEMLKNYAMLGVGTGDKGRVIITDNDLIEKSNLNRQFLFRDKDIHAPKSTTAATAVTAMNPKIKIDAFLDKVGPETEAKYSDAFFQSLNVVVTALDNVQARLYVDQRCITNHRPLLESGTMGTKGHVQVILPFKTETYASQRDPPEKDVPFCTIKSFPAQIEHCIQWARDKFKALFVDKPQELQKFFDDQTQYINSLRTSSGPKISTLRHLINILKNRPTTFDECIAYARCKFEAYFKNQILQLLHAFPLDMKLQDGSKFWTLPKRPPEPLEFNPNDPTHIDFIYHTAYLYATVFKIEPHCDMERLKKVCMTAKVPQFKPKSKRIETDEKAEKPKEEFNADEFDQLAQQLAQLSKSVQKFDLVINEFEKDDDTNHHVDFIMAAANLRAANYRIKPADRLETKRIAGKIIPAIATTTAAVAGLVSLELIKIVLELPLECFKNAFLNLALPFVSFSEPAPPEKMKIAGDTYFTVWDRWEIKSPDMTLQQFCDYFQKNRGLTVTGVFQDVHMIYVSLMPMHKKRLPMQMSKLLKHADKLPYVDLIVSFADEKGESVNGPTVRFHLK